MRYQTPQEDDNKKVHRRYHYGEGISFPSEKDWDTRIPIRPRKSHLRKAEKPKRRPHFLEFTTDITHIHAYTFISA